MLFVKKNQQSVKEVVPLGKTYDYFYVRRRVFVLNLSQNILSLLAV